MFPTLSKLYMYLFSLISAMQTLLTCLPDILQDTFICLVAMVPGAFFEVSEMDHSLKKVLKNISAASLMLSTVHPVDLNFLTADLFSSHFRCSASEFPLTCLSALFLDVVLQSAFLSLYLLSC